MIENAWDLADVNPANAALTTELLNSDLVILVSLITI